MAVLTPSDIVRDSAGSNTLITATFAALADNDTWTSGIQEVVGYWANATNNPTQGKEKIDMVLTTASTGLFTFYAGGDSRTGVVYVLAKI